MAIFAAIMLLASTQVELPEPAESAGGLAPTLMSKVVDNIGDSADNYPEEFDEAASPVSSGAMSSRSKKSRGLSLDLLQFRR